MVKLVSLVLNLVKNISFYALFWIKMVFCYVFYRVKFYFIELEFFFKTIEFDLVTIELEKKY